MKDVKFTRGDPLPNDKIVAWERVSITISVMNLVYVYHY